MAIHPKMSRASKLFLGLLAVLLCFTGLFFVCWNSLGGVSEDLYSATTYQKHNQMIRYIELGADVNYKFNGSTSCLQRAIENEDAAAEAILLRHGASISLLDGHFQRLLMAPESRRALAKEHFYLKD